MELCEHMRMLTFLRRRSTQAAVLLAAALLSSCGKSDKPPAPPKAAPTQRTLQVAIPGVEAYRQALAAADPEEALRLLHDAVHLNPKLAEAWYAIGQFKMKLAPDVVRTDETKGVLLFREALEAEREALALLDTGHRTVWSAEEEERARMTLARDLQDVDQVMADRDTLLAALRLRTR
jgi:tetratricopeptide (TPR) repeat protein